MALSTATPLTVARLSCLLLFGNIAGCPGRAETPEGALETFLANVRSRRGAPAYKALSAASRTEMERRAKTRAEMTGEAVETDPAQLIFSDLELVALRKPASIRVAGPLGDAVDLRVSVEGGETAIVKMVREGRGWKVDLFGSLDPFEVSGSETATTTPAAEGAVPSAPATDPDPQ